MKLLIAALLAVFSTTAMAEWTSVYSNENDTMVATTGTMVVYVDKTTIRKQGNLVKMWELMDIKKSPE